MLAIVQLLINMRADAYALQQRGFFPVNLDDEIVDWMPGSCDKGCAIRFHLLPFRLL